MISKVMYEIWIKLSGPIDLGSVKSVYILSTASQGKAPGINFLTSVCKFNPVFTLILSNYTETKFGRVQVCMG